MNPAASTSAEPSSGLEALALFGTLGRAGGALLDQVLLHVQLLSNEVRLEKVRLLKMLFIALLGLACLMCLLLSAGLLVLIAVWDTPYRLYSAMGLVFVYGCASVAALRVFQAHSARGGEAFAASRETLKADVRMLRLACERRA